MDELIFDQLQSAIISDISLTKEKASDILSPIFGDSLAMSKIFIQTLEYIPFVYDDAPCLPQNYDVYVENFYIALLIALENGLNPNEIVPYEGKEGGNNIMWTVVGCIRHSDISPKIMKTLLEHGGDPNTKLDSFDTVFTEVDDFFWLDGEELSENLLRCWLLLAVYGGDKGNIDFLPLKPLNGHSIEELKDYEKYTFSFETENKGTYKRSRVLFIVDALTGEKIAVNETPFG